MRAEYESKGVGFLALCLEPDEQQVRAGAERNKLQMRVAIAEDEVLGPFGVDRVPSTVFLDANGTIVAAASGPRDKGFFERRVRALMEK